MGLLDDLKARAPLTVKTVEVPGYGPATIRELTLAGRGVFQGKIGSAEIAAAIVAQGMVDPETGECSLVGKESELVGAIKAEVLDAIALEILRLSGLMPSAEGPKP